MKVAAQSAPTKVGIDLANWNWKVVRQFIEARCGIRLCPSAYTRYLHRLGFAYKRPKKPLLKADKEKRATFVADYAAVEARASAAKLFFEGEAHFRADGDLRGSGCSRAARHWWTRPARAGARRRATTRWSAWKPERSGT